MSNTASETVPKRRSLFSSDIALLAHLRDMAPDGEPISFADLDADYKRELLPQGEVSRLVKLRIATIKYDAATYAPSTVTIDPAKIKEFQTTIDAPPKDYNPPKPKGQPKPNLLGEYFIELIEPVKKPRTAGTEAGHNYNLYTNGMSITEYMASETEEVRKKLLKTNSGKWFNGPSFQLLYADMDAGNIKVYDANNVEKFKDDIAPRVKRQAEQEAAQEPEQQEAAE